MKSYPYTCVAWEKPRFTFLGMVLALSLGGMILSGLMHVLVIQPRLTDAHDSQRDMVQNARIAIEVLSRELRMAGYNPTGASFDGLAYAPTHLHIRADLDGDGHTHGPDEDIRYTYEAATQQIIRHDRAGQEPLAENIHAFAFAYLDQNDQPTTISAHIRQVRLTVTAGAAAALASRAALHSPRTYTLTTLINLRNVSAVTEPERS